MCDYPKGKVWKPDDLTERAKAVEEAALQHFDNDETVMVEMSVLNWKKLNKIKEDMMHVRGKPVSTDEALFELFYGRY
jgi:hypothetical protein